MLLVIPITFLLVKKEEIEDWPASAGLLHKVKKRGKAPFPTP